MALLAKSDEYLILNVQRQVHIFNTQNGNHNVTKAPLVARTKNGNDSNDEFNGLFWTQPKRSDELDGSLNFDSATYGDINCLAISYDSRLVAVTTNIDKFLYLFEIIAGDLQLSHFYQLVRAPSSIRFSPDSKTLLVADKTGDCFLYDVGASKGQKVNDAKWILGHLSIVLDIQMTSDSKFIITSDRNEKIKITNFPQTEVIESFCLGHTEFVPAIAELKTETNENLLISISGDRSLRLWNYLKGIELFQLDLQARGIRLAHNTKNEFAVVLLEDNFKIALYELETNEKPEVRLVTEHSLDESVKYINSIIYGEDNCIWYSYLNEQYQVFVKQLQVTRSNGQTEVSESNLNKVPIELLNELSTTKVQPFEDISLLFKKSFDNLTDYRERKRQRIENKHSK